MSFYSASVSPAAPGTTQDALTITGAAAGVVLVHEVSVSGEGTASAANELGAFRPTTLGVTPVAQVPAQIDFDSAPFGGTVATSFTTPSVITSVVALLRLGCNSNGGVYRWVAKPGEEIRLRGNATVSVSQLSLRFTLGGSQQMGVHAVFEGL